MRVVIQRVSSAAVTIQGKEHGRISTGLLLLLGIEEADGQEDIEWLCRKIVNLRIFNDDEGVMNKSLLDIDGEIMVVSQFTLHASTKKGNRPSYIQAAKPDVAMPLYQQFINSLQDQVENTVQTGEFGADMNVSLTNDGPVTILMDTKDKQ